MPDMERSSVDLRDDGAKCYGIKDATHGEYCYCGAPAKWHIYYGTGCGNVCGRHVHVIRRRKRLRLEPPYCVPLKDSGGR